MAGASVTTRLADSVVPEVFNSYMTKDTVQTMAFYDTGVLRGDAQLAANLAGGGLTFKVPFWKDLDDDESDTGSDDPDSHAIPGKLGSATDIARRQFRTKVWSAAKLTAELAGSDPMKRISSRTGAYWGRQFDDVCIATARGVFASNVANNSGDMVNDVSNDNVGAPATAELFGATSFMDTLQTMGDAKRTLNLVVMHSIVHTRLAKNDLIAFRPDSTGQVWHETYEGYRILVSDRVTKVVGTNRVRYHTYLFGPNAMGWAESPPASPVAVEEDESAGDGAGVETLWTRRQFAIHPYGIKWTDSSVGGDFPSNAELRLSANWLRVYPERKQIPMALLITNG
jgi:hypothetical protein